MEDELSFIIDTGLSMGAGYVEARYHSTETASSMMRSGTPEAGSTGLRRGMGIRVLVDGALAFGAVDRFDRDSMRGVLERTVRNARTAARTRRTPIAFAEADLGDACTVVKSRVAFEDVDQEARMGLLREVDDAIVSIAEAQDVKVPGRWLQIETETAERVVWTSDGARVRSVVPRAEAFAMITATGEGRSTQRMTSRGESRGWECVERWDLPRALGSETGTLASILKNAVKPPSGTMDMVLGPEVVGLIAHESSGHPGEADRVLGREAAQAGETYLGRGDTGRVVGSEAVNVVEDPTIPGSFGYYEYDDEGVRARRRHLIREGRIDEFLHNRETADVFGVEGNASSRSVAFDREPIVRMSNTFVDRGDHSFDELVEDVSSGVYLRDFMEWNIDDRRFNQRYVGLEAYEIVDGELGRRLLNPRLEMTTIGLWSAVDAVGDDLEFTSATCGKGDPMQGIPVWTGGPHMRLRGVRMGGSQ